MKTIEMNKLIAEFMGYEDASKFVAGVNYMRKKIGFKFGTDQYESIPYEELSYHKDWNLLIEAFHLFVTKLWNEGVDAGYLCRDFSECVERNAPLTAMEVLYNNIKSNSRQH